MYFARVFKNDVPKAMEILSDILQNSLLDEHAINAERDVILREMEEVNKVYEEQLLDHLHEAAFLGGGLGRTILGTEENIRSLTRNDLRDYIDTHYTADRFVIAGAGAVDHGQLVELSQKHFGGLPSRPKQGLVVPPEKAVFTGSDKLIRFDSMSEAHIALSYEGTSWTSEFAFPLMVIQTILGSYDRTNPTRNHATHFARDMHEHECAHSFTTFNTCYKDTGLFGVYLVCDEKKVESAVRHTLANIRRLYYHVHDSEVERAKNQLKANLLMNMDSYSNICEDIGRQMLTYDRRMNPAEIARRIDAVTTQDIIDGSYELFNDMDHALAAVGPIYELPDYNWIRRRSYKLIQREHTPYW